MAQQNSEQSRREAEATMKNLLIDLVKARPLIYDKSHPLHYCTNARNEAWDEISKILGIPGKFLKFFCDCTM